MELKHLLNNDKLTIFLSGRLDTSNQEQIGAVIDDICSKNEYKDLVIDIEELEYISSAGLRLILKLKKANASFKIINASLEVYDIFDMTGFADIIEIEKAYRKFKVDGLKVIAEGAKGIVYRYNEDTILKVFKNPDSIDMIKRERQLAKKAFVMGLPTAISYDVVKVDDKYGSVFELLESKTLSSLIAEGKIEEAANIFVSLLKDIHAITVNDEDIPGVDYVGKKWVNEIKGAIDENTWNKLNNMVESIIDTKTLLHMDYHSNNILMQGSEALLIDMDTLSKGNIIYELANIYVTYVGFKYISVKFIEDFIGTNINNIDKFYGLVIDQYLGEKKTIDVLNKIELLGDIRVLRHIVRRGSDINVDDLKARICELANKVDNFNI